MNPDLDRVDHRLQVLVIGAAKGLGRWIVEHVLAQDPRLTLTLADINPMVTDVAEQLSAIGSGPAIRGRCIAYGEDGSVNGLGVLSRFDAVLVAVPVEHVPLVARAILSLTRPGVLIVDIASLKVDPLAEIMAHAPPEASVVGTHPLFGLPLESIAGQTVVICRTERSDEAHVALIEDVIRRHGATVRHLTPEEHDRQMRIVQALPHFVVLTVGETLRQADVDLRSALRLQTPPFRALAGLIGRILGLKNDRQAELYASIQQAPSATEIREVFVRASQSLHETFAKRQLDSSRAVIESIAQSLSKSAVEECAAQAEEAISSRHVLDRTLLELQRTQRVCAFRHRDGRMRVGRIIRVDSAAVLLRGEIVEREGERAAIYDGESQHAAGLLGLGGTPSDYELPRRYYRLLSRGECDAWRQRELKRHRVDLTLGLPSTMNVVAVCDYLERLVPEILSCKPIGSAYHPPRGAARRITLRLRTVGDRSPQRSTNAAIDFVESIGGEGPRLA